MWHAIETDQEPVPLSGNPSLAQIKAYKEEKLRKD